MVGEDERALILQILDERSDRERYRVYGDWLEARGDPRGPLVALQLRADETDRADGALLVKEKTHFIRYPQLTPPLDTWRAHYRWRWGFIDEAHLERPTPDELRTLLDHRACVLLRSLRLDLEGKVPAVLDAIAQDPPTLEVLTLNALGAAGLGSSELWRQMPRLDSLVIEATGLFSDLAHPRLRSLALEGVAFSPAGRWDVPALATLHWRDAGPVESLGPLLRAWPPELRSLVLVGCSPGYEIEDFLRAISALTALTISSSAFGSRRQACSVLARHAPRFRHLEHLMLELDLFDGDDEDDEDDLGDVVAATRRVLPQLQTEAD